MIDTLKIYNELKMAMDPIAAEKIADAIGLVYEELRHSVTKAEFNELRDVVAELAAAQKRTEERLEQLAQAQKHTEERVEQLAQAQNRTEQRLEQLAEAQKRTEERLEQLAEAQKRTEERLEQLAEAQKHTEERLEQLAQAQRHTEERVNELTQSLTRLTNKVEDLVGEMKVFKKELGGLAHTVGYRLEDEAMKALPGLLRKDHAIEIQGPLVRDYFEIGPNRYVELNIWGWGTLKGKRVAILGEAKSQLKKGDVDGLLQTIRTLEPCINHDIIPILVTYQTSPKVREYVKAKGIHLYFSYQL